jgi:hypothetical protein
MKQTQRLLRVNEQDNEIINKVIKERKREVLISEEQVGFSATTRWLYKKEHATIKLNAQNSNAELEEIE